MKLLLKKNSLNFWRNSLQKSWRVLRRNFWNNSRCNSCRNNSSPTEFSKRELKKHLDEIPKKLMELLLKHTFLRELLKTNPAEILERTTNKLIKDFPMKFLAELPRLVLKELETELFE